jgi:hypothetical protein
MQTGSQTETSSVILSLERQGSCGGSYTRHFLLSPLMLPTTGA